VSEFGSERERVRERVRERGERRLGRRSLSSRSGPWGVAGLHGAKKPPVAKATGGSGGERDGAGSCDEIGEATQGAYSRDFSPAALAMSAQA
jgi:hypothetical protein